MKRKADMMDHYEFPSENQLLYTPRLTYNFLSRNPWTPRNFRGFAGLWLVNFINDISPPFHPLELPGLNKHCLVNIQGQRCIELRKSVLDLHAHDLYLATSVDRGSWSVVGNSLAPTARVAVRLVSSIPIQHYLPVLSARLMGCPVMIIQMYWPAYGD